jgi:processive 1,2-diacylglycerol beta-glucosyltransferase
MQIAVTGIPIMPVFSTAIPRQVAAAEIGVDRRRHTVLMMAGGAGVGGIDLLARRLASLPIDLQILALAGRNQALLGKLTDIAGEFPGRVWPLGFTRTIERLMSASDLAITKPGGLTSSECLAMNLPMIVVAPIPGQEERNADFLMESGAALKAIDEASLAYKVRRLFEHAAELSAMRTRMKSVARREAAASMLRLVSAATR